MSEVQMSNFEDSLARCRRSYDALFDLLDTYPAAKREQPGACGVWTPKQVVAHLSGWMTEAERRYDAFEQGDTQEAIYDDDTFNAQSVRERDHLDWTATTAELCAARDRLIERAAMLPPERIDAERRYQEWLDGLGYDCYEHTEQLRQFAKQ